MPERKEKKTLYILYVLGLYILAQVCWWGYSLIHVHWELYHVHADLLKQPEKWNVREKVWMILGEGGVFIILLAFGFWKIRKNIAREMRLARMEKTFFLSVTHELKTPIAAIRLFLETLQSRKLSDEQQKIILSDALRETLRLQSFSENILLATKLDHTKEGLFKEWVDLSSMLHSETNRYRKINTGNREFSLQADGHIAIKGDRSLLQSVFSNLIENAVKYSPAHSCIQLRLHREGEWIKFFISNEGDGILPEEAKKIFEKFYRPDNEQIQKQKGTGLGLYIVKSVVRLHQGQITVSSHQQSGCTFEVTFPLSQK